MIDAYGRTWDRHYVYLSKEESERYTALCEFLIKYFPRYAQEPGKSFLLDAYKQNIVCKQEGIIFYLDNTDYDEARLKIRKENKNSKNYIEFTFDELKEKFDIYDINSVIKKELNL